MSAAQSIVPFQGPREPAARSVPRGQIILTTTGQITGMDFVGRDWLRHCAKTTRGGKELTAITDLAVWTLLENDFARSLLGVPSAAVVFPSGEEEGRTTTARFIPIRSARGDVEAMALFLSCEGREPAEARENSWKPMLIAAVDRERQQLGQRLHNELFPHLLGAAFAFQATAQHAPAGEALAEEMKKLALLLNSAVVQSRSLVRSGEPAQLDAIGLRDALQELLGSLPPEAQGTMEFFEGAKGPAKQAIWHAYRVAQEAVANVTRHAGATQVRLRLDFSQPASPYLEISDNGRGFLHRPENKAACSGLALMQLRAEASGGVLALHTTVGRGTTVIYAMPAQE